MALRNPDNFYLIDPAMADGAANPLTVLANTILACSPDRRHYKEWAPVHREFAESRPAKLEIPRALKVESMRGLQLSQPVLMPVPVLTCC